MTGPARFSMIGLLFVLFALTVAPAQDNKRGHEDKKDAEEKVYELTTEIAPPRVLHQVPPDCPPHLRGVRIEGLIAIGLVVDSRGDPKNPQVVRGLEKDVDQSAIEAVKQWRFAPAKREGKAVAVRITIEIEFHSM